MALQALSGKAESSTAFNQFRRTLIAGVRPLPRKLGWHGGGGTFNVYWLVEEGIWCVLESFFADRRFWCSFGVGDPHTTNNLTITCEINPPFRGVNRRVAGAFVRDDSGELHVAHSGKVGGGRKGIGQAAFLDVYRGIAALAPITFADGATHDMIVLGALKDPALRSQIGHFVREVQRVKALLSVTSPTKAADKKDRFRPEFSGSRRVYSVGTVKSVATHGLVVDALIEALASRGLAAPHNDGARDLYFGPGSNPTHLFEVKTDLSLSSFYAAVGQLMLHGGGSKKLRRVVVVPGRPTANTAKALSALGISVVSYRWKGKRPIFSRLVAIIPVPKT